MARKSNRKRKSTEEGGKLTEAEWVIMKVVWDNQPCAAGAVQEALEQSQNWAYSTVKTTMDRMVAKGLLETQAIRNLTLYSPRITEDQARKGEFRSMLKRAFDGALTPMLQFLIQNERLSKADLKRLRDLVNKAEKKG